MAGIIMEKKVKIQINSTQDLVEGESDVIEFEEEGIFYIKNDIYYLVYKNQAEGLDGARTIVKIDPGQDQIIILRSKPAKMEQTFRKDETLEGSYSTQYGNLRIKNKTEVLEYNLNQTGGKINLVYDLFINNQKYTKNKLKISYQDFGVESC